MRDLCAPHPDFPLRESLCDVMAGLVPAIHASPHGTKNVDARDKPGHDDLYTREQSHPAAFLAITLR